MGWTLRPFVVLIDDSYELRHVTTGSTHAKTVRKRCSWGLPRKAWCRPHSLRRWHCRQCPATSVLCVQLPPFRVNPPCAPHTRTSEHHGPRRQPSQVPPHAWQPNVPLRLRLHRQLLERPS
jgi:hypothetical protein